MIGRTYVTDDQFAALDQLVPANGSFLEVGSGAGITAARMATGSRLVVCVDNYPDLDAPQVIEDDGDRWAAWRLNTPASVRLWRGDLTSFRRISDYRFDVAFIDADHTMPNAAFDLVDAAWMARTIVAHDYGEPKHPDVAVAVDGFCRRYGWRIAKTVEFMAVLENCG
jgi:predicted O-methyltransferase YrrM